MVKPIRWAGSVAFCSVVLWLLPGSISVLAGTCLEDPCKSGCICIPNVKYFGHFETMWRRWPGKPQPDTTFPQSIGAEVIPTPPARKQPPLPKPTQLPGGPRPTLDALPLDGGILPLPDSGILPPPDGGILPPPEGGFRFDEQELPEQPQTEPPAGMLPPGGLSEPPAGSATPSSMEPPAVPVNPVNPPASQPPVEEPLLPSTFNDGPDLPKLASQPVVRKPGDERLDGGNELPEPVPQPFSVEPEPEPVQSAKDNGEKLPEPVPQPVAAKPASEPATLAEDGGDELPEIVPQPVADGTVDPQPPDGSELPKPQPVAEKPKAKALQANWMAALHPGFRGDAGLRASRYPPREPARPVIHQAAVYPSRGGPVPRFPPDRRGTTPKAKTYKFQHSGEQPASHVEEVRPSDSPPVAMDGYCPVELITNERWVPGDPGLTATYQGRTYLFSGRTQRQLFLSDPRSYTPRYSGHDPVLAVDGKRHVLGQTDYCVTYKGRLYLFSSSVTLTRFRDNPQRYAKADGE